MSKRIVLLTPGQPTLNPRLVKEADVLADAGYSVTVIYSYWNAWATELDIDLLKNKKWKAVRVGGDPKSGKITYWLSRLVYKAVVFFYEMTGPGAGLGELAIGRSAALLGRAACREKADLYIAHNLAALPAAVKAAKRNGGRSGFDAEDLHRFETSGKRSDKDVLLKVFIEDKYLSQASYLTTSSPQIANAYKQLYPDIDPAVIYNVFPGSYLRRLPENSGSPRLRLFWFSQTIGANRGLRDIVEALLLLGDPAIELHLLGDTPSGDPFIKELDESGIKINYYPPVAPDALVGFSSQFDIGLALEPGFCMNNDLALSNKMFTYLQAGLAIVASDTLAQQNFVSTHPAIGKIYPKGDAGTLAAILDGYKRDRKKLTDAKLAALQLARERFNWEQESVKFMDIIKNTLGG